MATTDDISSAPPPWLLPRELLLDASPSRADGMTAAVEHTMRRSTCGMMSEIGMRLLEKKASVATALVLFQRFFSRCSLLRHDRMAVAVASLLVAGKSTDFANPARAALRHFVPDYLARTGHTAPAPERGELFAGARERLVQAERLLLFTLEYDLEVDLPFRHLQRACRDMGVAEAAPLSQGAVRSANEALRSTLCVQYAARTLALGCLAFARDQLLARGLFVKPERWDEVVEAGGGALGAGELRALREALADITRQIEESLAVTREALASAAGGSGAAGIGGVVSGGGASSGVASGAAAAKGGGGGP